MKNEFYSLLTTKLNVEIYNTPVDRADCIVFLARLKPMMDSDRNLAMAEARALKFIEDALKLAKDAKDWQLRLSRPWVLKKDKIAFTWDFTFQGDLQKCHKALEEIEVMRLAPKRELEVPVQQIKRKKGKVRQVQIGAIR